jgi:hypothetical protein
MLPHSSEFIEQQWQRGQHRSALQLEHPHQGTKRFRSSIPKRPAPLNIYV